MKRWTFSLLVLLTAAMVRLPCAAESGRLLEIKGVTHSQKTPNTVEHPCVTPRLGDGSSVAGLRGFPVSPLESVTDTLIHCLVLRVEFQPESPDDPNTTGKGLMDLRRPFDNAVDSAHYFDSVGHLIDPPPHDSLYFHAHMRALREYWHSVSKGKIDLTWDIYPPGKTAVYRLPHPMSYYGKCDFSQVVGGLEAFAQDAIHAADSAHLTISGHPDINFKNYQAVFLFHAGADRQNDIGFPATCSDLFTGFIRFGVPVRVDNGAYFVPSALMMPETADQDNRATALNAVMAHEFGHQLGLPDIYSTRGFLSQLGDFDLMDDNGFGTGVDFGFPAGNSFGTVPVYPSAWCRAYLGLDPVVDVRSGSDLRLLAAATQASGTRLYRFPISETEYFLFENRVSEIDNRQTFLLVDSATNVILGPVNSDRQFTGEYDFLIPGDGGALYYVDESVAAEDVDGDGFNNYQDNQLQIVDPAEPRKFLTLIEGDGLQHFGGFYRSGFGRAADLYRDGADRNQNFTPLTNPPSRTQNGTSTGIKVTAINRTFNDNDQLIDSVLRFDVALDRRVPGSPVRVGRPSLALSPIATDLDGDSNQEIIVAAGSVLTAFEPDGRGFLDRTDSCTTCPPVFDSAGSSVFGWDVFNNPRPFRLPLFARVGGDITANPVAGLFGTTTRYTAIGYPAAAHGVANNGRVLVLAPTDINNDAQADRADSIVVNGWPIAAQLNSALWIGTDAGRLYYKASLGGPLVSVATGLDSIQGMVQLGRGLGVLFVHNDSTSFCTFSPSNNFATVNTYRLGYRLTLGPVAADMDGDSHMEVFLFSSGGNAAVASFDTTALPSSTDGFALQSLETAFTSNPIIADIDNDNTLEVVIGGNGVMHAFTHDLITVENFPRLLNEKFRHGPLLATPIAAQLERGGSSELAVTCQTGSGSEAGALYLLNEHPLPGTPLTMGRMIAGQTGSPIFLNGTGGGRLGLHGADGWFYLLSVDSAGPNQFWPMYGQNASGDFTSNPSANGNGTPRTLDKATFYAYDNPTTSGMTRLRYALPSDAVPKSLTIFDLSGLQIASFPVGSASTGTSEFQWDCGQVVPGVYRAVLEFDLAGKHESAYTDVAVLR